MFYKTGVDITNDKQMFNFLKGHFTYAVIDTWNYRYTIANKVKLYTLGLSGDWCVALSLLESGEYENLHSMIHDWELAHPGYEVYFNGRNSGYLVLKQINSNGHVLPDSIVDSDDYEEYKDYCRSFIGSVKENRSELVYYTKLVQDFDKLCDELRDFCDELSKLSFEVVTMNRTIELFNEQYEDDLELIGFEKLTCEEHGKVNVSEIITLVCLFEAFCRVADRSSFGYELRSDENGFVYYARL